MNTNKIMRILKFTTLALFIILFGCSSPLLDTIKEEVDIVESPPTITVTYPEAGSVGIPVNLDDILITYTKQINSSSVGSSTFIIKDSDDNTITGTYSVSNDTISFNPSSNLSFNKSYTITANVGIIDVDGNPMSSEFSWDFTTEDAPAGVKPLVKYVRINDNQSATNIPTVKLDISATDYTGNIQNLKAHYRVLGDSQWSDWLAVVDGILTIIDITLDVSEDGELVIFEVEVRDSTDIVSNPFLTEILYDLTSPKENARNWENADFDLTQGIIQISFDDEMELSSFTNDNFYIELESTPGKLQGQRDLVAAGGINNSGAILEGVSLNPYTDYRVTLGSDVTDIAGNSLGVSHEWTFRTGKADDIAAPDGPVSLIDRGVGAYTTVLPSGTLATSDYRIRIDLSDITDDYSNIVGMKFWGDWDDGGTPSYAFEPSSWELFPSVNRYKDWNISDTAGTKTVLFKFIDSNNQASEGALQVEVFLDNENPSDPVLTINEGDYTNSSERIISLNLVSSDDHTGLKEMNIFDGTTNDGWINWSSTYNEWILPDADGSYTITINVRDYVNLTSNNMGSTSIILDRVAPELSFVSGNIPTGTPLQLDSPTHYTVNDPDPGAAAYQIPSGIATYHWEQVTGSVGAVSFTNQNVSNPTVSASVEGSYYLQLTVTDNAGSSTTEDVQFIWDATPPGNIDTISVSESNPGYSTSAQPEWSWSAATGADYYSISWNNFSSSENIGTVTAYSPDTALSEGSHTLYVRAYDFAGNYSSTISRLVTVDTIAPAIDVDQSEYVTYTEDTQIIIDFSTDNGSFGYISGADTILWEQENGPSGGTITFGSASTSATSVEADIDGNYQIRLTASDNAGNMTSVDLSLLNDLTIPGTPIVTGTPLTPNMRPTWYWSSGGEGTGTYRYQLYNIDDAIFVVNWTATTATSYKPPSNLTDVRNYRMDVEEFDAAGNLSSTGIYTTEVDTSQTTPAQIVIGDGYPTLRTINTVEWDVLTGSGGIATNYRYYYDSSGSWLYGGTGLSNGTPNNFDRTGLSEGSHSLTIQEYFNGSWQSALEATHSITVDTIAPSAPILNGEGLTTDDSDRTATDDNYPTWSWSSGGGGSGQYEYSTDNGSNWYTITSTNYTPYKLEGTFSFWIRERDDAGNWSSYDTHRITVDTTPPILTSVFLRDPSPYESSTTHTNSTTVYVDLVGNISAENEDVTLRYLDYNPVTAYENYGSPFSTDGTMTISTALPSTNGTRTVYAQLVDEAGNESAYRNDSIILDTVSPTGTFYVNNNAAYTPSLSQKLYYNVTDNLSITTDLEVTTRDYYDSNGDGYTEWSSPRAYSAVLTSNYQFSKNAGGKYAYTRIYDEAGNYLYKYDYIILQVPEPVYAYKGYYTTGYSNIYYNSVTEDSGTYLTRYYVYSTTNSNADPNNGDPVTNEYSTTSTTYRQAYIPKGEILYFFTRAYNADTGGYGPYSATNVMGFSSNVTVVYDASDSTDTAKALYIKELLEDTYFSGSILDESNMAGSMPTYTVTLLDEDLINNTAYSTYNTIYGDPIIVTPGTAFSRLSSTYDIRVRHIAAGGRGIIGMYSNGQAVLDRIEENWSAWSLSGTAPSQIGDGESAGIGTSRSSKLRPASTSESIWHSPMQNSYLTSNFQESSIALNIFSSDTYRDGVYLGTNPVVTDGYVYAGDPAYTTYYPVVRQGRFLQYGYQDIPGRGYAGSMTYQYGQIFFINLIARMDNF